MYVQIPGHVVETESCSKLYPAKSYAARGTQSITAEYIFNCLPYNITGISYQGISKYSKGDSISLYVNKKRPSVAFVDSDYLSIWKRIYYSLLNAILLKITESSFDFIGKLKAAKVVFCKKCLPHPFSSASAKRSIICSKKKVKQKTEFLKNRVYHRSEPVNTFRNVQKNPSLDRAYFIACILRSILLLLFVSGFGVLLADIVSDAAYRINYTVLPAEVLTTETVEDQNKLCLLLSSGDELHLTLPSSSGSYLEGDSVFVAMPRKSDSENVILSEKNISFNRTIFVISTSFTFLTLIIMLYLFLSSIHTIIVFLKVTRVKTRLRC